MNRPYVVDLRDWLACVALLMAILIMSAVIVLGYGVLDAIPVGDPNPNITQLVPDPGVRPSPMPGPPIVPRALRRTR